MSGGTGRHDRGGPGPLARHRVRRLLRRPPRVARARGRHRRPRPRRRLRAPAASPSTSPATGTRSPGSTASPSCWRRCASAPTQRAGGQTVVADARDFSLDRRFGLIVVPMQTIQLLGGPGGRAELPRVRAAAPGARRPARRGGRRRPRELRRRAHRAAAARHPRGRGRRLLEPAGRGPRRRAGRDDRAHPPDRAARRTPHGRGQRDQPRPPQPRSPRRRAARGRASRAQPRAIAPTGEHVGSRGGDAACLRASCACARSTPT